MAEHRVALIAPSHWHYPLYRPAFSDPGVRIAGVWDPSAPQARAVAAEFGCPVFGGVEELLDRSGAGFAFAFGVHADLIEDPRSGRVLCVPYALARPDDERRG